MAAPRKLDLGLQEPRPRPPVVVPGNLRCTSPDQPDRVPLLDRVEIRPAKIDYPAPRGATPTGYPTPTSPNNPNGAPSK